MGADGDVQGAAEQADDYEHATGHADPWAEETVELGHGSDESYERRLEVVREAGAGRWRTIHLGALCLLGIAAIGLLAVALNASGGTRHDPYSAAAPVNPRARQPVAPPSARRDGESNSRRRRPHRLHAKADRSARRHEKHDSAGKAPVATALPAEAPAPETEAAPAPAAEPQPAPSSPPREAAGSQVAQEFGFEG